MNALRNWLHKLHELLHANTKQFIRYLLLAFLPFITVSVMMNIRFLRAQREHTVSILQDVALQAGNQMGFLYNISASIAQHVSNNLILQDDVLLTPSDSEDFQQINRNILKLNSLVNTYQFFEEISSIRFFLPENLIIADEKMLHYVSVLQDRDWYQAYLSQPLLHRWYLTDDFSGEDGQSYVSLVSSVRNPNDYLQHIGMLSVDISLNYMADILHTGMILEQTDGFLVDCLGQVILHEGSLPEDLFQGTLALSSLETAQSLSIGTTAYFGCMKAIADTDMYLVYLVPESSITHNNLLNYSRQFLLMLVEIVIVMLLTATLAFTAISSRNNRLQLLNQQINPHFLYNALDMINWKAINSKMPEIYQPIQKLSRFYKLTLNHGLDFITLREEFDQLRLYLELQDSRFGHRIRYTLQLPEELSDCVVLHMILQPVVENAILHGILEQEDRKGHIQITAETRSDQLLITISDDGIGMDEAKRRSILHGNGVKGYGLKNVQERIQLFYGRRYGLTVESQAGKGTHVSVLFPLRRNSAG